MTVHYYTKDEADKIFVSKLELEKQLKDERHNQYDKITECKVSIEDRVNTHHEDLAGISRTLAVMSEVLKDNAEKFIGHTNQEMSRFESIGRDIKEIKDQREKDRKEHEEKIGKDQERIVELEKKNSLLKGIGYAVTFLIGSGVLLSFCGI